MDAFVTFFETIAELIKTGFEGLFDAFKGLFDGLAAGSSETADEPAA